MESILQILLITALLSILINTFLKKYDFPPIIGYIIAGAFVTYVFSLRDTSLHILHEISEFGIAFLMFTIGLEFSVTNFKKLKKEVFIFGTFQVVLSGLLFTIISNYLFHLSPQSSIIIGFALALSSTAIVLKIINENRDVQKDYGRMVLGILLFQDLAVIPILLMITFFSTSGVALEIMLINTLISAILVLLILFFAGKYLVTPFLRFVFNSHSHELFIASVLLIATAASYTAYHFGFSYSLGAFIGGMLLAETPFKHQIQADLTPFRDLLLGVFFVSVGMQVSVEFLVSNIADILAVMTTVMLLKAFVIFFILKFFTVASNALKSALALSQVGEFSFVVLELARINGITSQDINQTLIIAVVFSMILTPFIVKNLQTIVEKILRSKEKLTEPFSTTGISGHIVVLGYGSLGQQICKIIKEKGLLYIAIDNKHKLVKTSQENSDPFILGNANQKHILCDANVKNAMAVLITVENDEDTNNLVESVFHLSPTVNIVVSSRVDKSKLMFDKRIRFFVHEHEEVAARMTLHALTCNLTQSAKL
ncbi:cation:proton antiporter [Candidatus Sulfurimonas marisnigri]|uniref:Cation:proton antiporter n=1 Tax=Candidatus Sulfurimonas marisnigri TaxID=2740405 RepID=A0A7S7LYA0_9BACT|nr:cation:proton antiporter [Candidatus Sulfurimonas marisnigri]QOY53631.1 cation:proton antiporter [Candidatus Sulfurimonas marisnigri]